MTNEQFSILAHIIVTIALIIIYFLNGQDDPTMQSIMLMIIGYWFGSVPMNFKK